MSADDIPPPPTILSYPPKPKRRPMPGGRGGSKKGCLSPIDGKPWSLNDATASAIIESIEAGASIAGAMRAAGVARRNYYDWKRKAENGKEPYRAFFHNLELAWGRFEDRNVKVIANAATEGDWKAAAWALERHHSTRERYRATWPTKLDLKRDRREEIRLAVERAKDKREAEKHAREMGTANTKVVNFSVTLPADIPADPPDAPDE